MTPARAGAVLAILLLAAGPVSSGAAKKPPAGRSGRVLEAVASYFIAAPEPSDLAIDDTGRVLWTVSDKTGRVYELGVDGHVVRTLGFVGEDLEGIAYDRSNRTLWVAEETRREIVHLDREGAVLSRHRLDLTGEPNSGLEGICFDAAGRLFALNEKRPGLFLEIDEHRAIVARREITFAGDYSGMTYEPRRDAFWIVSDQSCALYLWSPKSGVLAKYALPFQKAEGVAVDHESGRIYIVSDEENQLYVYRLPSD